MMHCFGTQRQASKKQAHHDTDLAHCLLIVFQQLGLGAIRIRARPAGGVLMSNHRINVPLWDKPKGVETP